MDSKYSNLEFFDFENATDAEIKEVQSILEDSKKNRSLELPWQVPIRRKNSTCHDHEGLIKKDNSEFPVTSSTNCSSEASQHLNFVNQPVPLPPVTTQLVDPLVTLPTAVGPYPNAPYFVSRAVPYLRAFPHMGVQFFACPISGAGEANPYGQFLPIAQTVTVPEKNNPPLKTSSADKHLGKGITKKHPKCTVHNQIDHSGSKLTEQSLNERSTSVSVVPLPASTFAGAIPLHGYPPGLHTLPYTPMSVHQAPSPAMYYVPVFSHPYSSYMTPPVPPVVLPVNIHPEEVIVDDMSVVDKTPSDVQEHIDGDSTQDTDVNKPQEAVKQACNDADPVIVPCKSPEGSPSNIVPHSSEEQPSADNAKLVEEATKSVNNEPCAITKPIDKKPCTDTKPIEKQPCAGAKPLQEPPCSDVKPKEQQDTECSLSSQDTCSSPESIPASTNSNRPPSSSSQCWADLFKNPHTNKVNGISRLNLTENKLKSKNFKKGVINGKAHNVPSSSIH